MMREIIYVFVFGKFLLFFILLCSVRKLKESPVIYFFLENSWLWTKNSIFHITMKQENSPLTNQAQRISKNKWFILHSQYIYQCYKETKKTMPLHGHFWYMYFSSQKLQATIKVTGCNNIFPSFPCEKPNNNLQFQTN